MEVVLERKLAPHASNLLQPLDAEDSCLAVFERLDEVQHLLRANRPAEACHVFESIRHCLRSGPSTTPQATPGNSPAKPDPDDAYFERYLADIAAQAKERLHTYVSEGRFSEAESAKEILRNAEPSYLDIETEMEFFAKCQQVFELGSFEELASSQPDKDCPDHLFKALNIYNEGCNIIELRHWAKDPPHAGVWIHDHDSCANLFFAAARLCLLIHDLVSSGQCSKPFTPKDAISKMRSPEDNWRLQAVRFIERGRARGMRRTMENNDQLRDLLMTTAGGDTSPGGFDSSDTPSSPLTPLSSSREASEEPRERHHRRKRSEENWKKLFEHTKRQRTSRNELDVPTIVEGNQPRRSDHRKATPCSRFRDATGLLLNALKLRDESPKLDLSKVWQCIPEDTIVVEYALATFPPLAGLITIVSTCNGVIHAAWKPLSSEEVKRTISSLHRCLRKQVQTESAGDTRDLRLQDRPSEACPFAEADLLSKELREVLVRPIQPLIQSDVRIVVIPSGAMANTPFSMLFDNPICIVPSLAIFEYLVERSRKEQVGLGSPHVFPSGRTKDSEESTLRSPNIFLSNKPIGGDNNEASIQYSRIEALYLSQTQEPKTLPVLADELEFQPLAHELRGRNIVHMCGHSDFNRRHPFGSKTYNTRKPLSLLDWIELNVRANLVVFSSCLSAFTQLSDSGHGFGFSYTLLSTGTRAFIGSLWPVNDQATFLFMMLFYGFLGAGISPAEALHKAQTHLRDLDKNGLLQLVGLVRQRIGGLGDASEYVSRMDFWLRQLEEFDVTRLRSPAYWAAFSLVGHGLDVLPS